MNPRQFAYALLLTICLLFGLIGGFSSLSEPDGPASQGRPITPAGSLVQDLTTRQVAVGAVPGDLGRRPDKVRPCGEGRLLVVGRSARYGVKFNPAANGGQQSIAVIDLNAKPAAVVQNVYFPSPQSVNVGVVFSPVPDADGSHALYFSGGFENKIWIFRFHPEEQRPITPTSPGPNTTVEAPFIDVSGFATAANSPRYNSDRAPVYPSGLAISPDGNTLFAANNLGDSLGIVDDLRDTRKLTHLDLGAHVYPYAVVAVHERGAVVKAYVSCWNDHSVAVVYPNGSGTVSRIAVDRHPT